MAWKKGFSWTEGYIAETKNPDGTITKIKVHSGPFFWFPIRIKDYVLEVYLGFRPTPTWDVGYGNEGLFPKIAQWLKKKGWGNLGFAFRIKKVKGKEK